MSLLSFYCPNTDPKRLNGSAYFFKYISNSHLFNAHFSSSNLNKFPPILFCTEYPFSLTNMFEYASKADCMLTLSCIDSFCCET